MGKNESSLALGDSGSLLARLLLELLALLLELGQLHETVRRLFECLLDAVGLGREAVRAGAVAVGLQVLLLRGELVLGG